jgi:sporulation protein YlmC with PRC-barrel domain
VKIRLQHLIGSQVRDSRGERIGRIASVHAQTEGMHCFVFEYHVGPAAVLERLGMSVGRLIGVHGRKPLRIPWQQLDITNEREPRLRCSLEELQAMQ